ncbi:MAG: DUF4399 domain-containing protein [Cyclobacteriaceae bacterium]|nr:DUF4399 domain-containing protein [Cyclobacteriaceae bacterium]
MKKYVLLLIIPFTFYACNSPQKTEGNKEESISVEEVSTKEEKGVFFVSPSEGGVVQNPVKVVFGVKGMEIEPAGEVKEGKGHHHIIIDGSFIKKGVVVPADSMNIHYGKGQTETELTLSPGEHTLTMQFADGFHQSYGEEWSNTISITVGE